MRLVRTAVATLLAGLSVLAFPSTALAADPENPCDVAGWFVNPDEAGREPTRTTSGFVFEDTDLIHHDAPSGLTTKTLSSGDYTATPAPDQPSFFSVEVNGTDGGYATLRYNRSTHLWNMVTAGVLYEHADPDVLVDLPPQKKSHTVVRFGVGYTKNPPGTVKTTVESVSFQGEAYTFSCLTPSSSPSPTKTSQSPTPSTSPTSPFPTASSTVTASASSSVTRTPTSNPSLASATPAVPADPDDNLPVTGSSLRLMLLAGVGLALLGAAAVALTWRKSRH